jgi:hypothetical protein
MAATSSNHLEAFPAWARELSEKYYSRTISMFVLHGNVRDLVLSYDRGGGLSFATPDMKADFDRAMAGYDSFHGTSLARGLPRNPDSFAETIVPAGDSSAMPAEDRNSLVILKRWAQNPVFLQADVTFCLIAENLIELNLGLVQNPGVASIQIPLPDESERLDLIAAQPAATNLPPGSDVTPGTLAKLTAGLKRVQLQSLIADAAESGGLLEFVQSRFDLSMVAGQAAAKRKLPDAAQAIRAGRTDVVPMGYVICGPVGTGKTFLTTCFAGETGVPAVTLKNFRSMRQGVTEGNLERVLNLLKAMSPIAVIVDEADAQLGNRSSSGDSGVGNRVFAQIAQFMGNTNFAAR